MIIRAILGTIVLSLLPVSIAQADIVMFGSGANQFGMEFVPIGNPGNAPDTTGNPNPAGAVGYNYRMAKFEVSEDMINKYNAEYGTANGLAITKDTRGINKPATSVSWNEAARFVNWLNTSTGGFAAYKFTTSGVNSNIGLWTSADTLDYNPANPFRSLRANYVLPSVDEWYKASFFDPNTNTYFNYPTGSDMAPTPVASSTSPGTAVYGNQLGPADVDDAGGLSPFGVMGLGGNVYEIQETEEDLFNNSPLSPRGVRGGAWGSIDTSLASIILSVDNPTLETIDVGFRVASLDFSSVPEPCSMLGTIVGLSGLMHQRKRRGK